MGLTGFNLRRRNVKAKLKSVETKEPIEKSAQKVTTESPVVEETTITEKVEETPSVEETPRKVGRKPKK